MPAQHKRRTTKQQASSPRVQVLPHPGLGGYDYPRGPFGKTGFPGSTPAAKPTKGQGRDNRNDRQLDAQQAQARDTGWEFQETWPVEVPKPQPSYGSVRFRPGSSPRAGNRFLREGGDPRQPFARQKRSTSPEHRMTPIIGGSPGSQNVRNAIAQRYKARPDIWRSYRPAPNPGKTGARLSGPSWYHHDVHVYGEPDGKPVGGMTATPGNVAENNRLGGDLSVVVQSRFVSHEGSQEGYAMNRDLFFAKGGTPAPQPRGAAPHIRGGRFDGTRYFGNLGDQQKIGLPSDSYGIKRARGPNHRPVRFEQPPPHTANYYDLAPDEGDTAPDQIHRSPVGPRRAPGTTRGSRGPTPRARRGRG